MKNPFRIGEKVYLRAIEFEDLANLQRWINDPEVTRYLSAIRPMNAIAEREWIESQAKRADEVCLMIVARDGDLPVGTIGLHRVGGPNRSAVLGISIGEKGQWNRGLGTEAMRLISAYGFDTLNLHRIELQVYAGNSRARHVYERVGFRLEGIRREARFNEGAWEDVYLMGLLEHEFRERDNARKGPGSAAVLRPVLAGAESWPGAV